MSRIVFLSMADTELLTLSQARRSLPAGFPPVRAGNPNQIADLDAFLDERYGRPPKVAA